MTKIIALLLALASAAGMLIPDPLPFLDEGVLLVILLGALAHLGLGTEFSPGGGEQAQAHRLAGDRHARQFQQHEVGTARYQGQSLPRGHRKAGQLFHSHVAVDLTGGVEFHAPGDPRRRTDHLDGLPTGVVQGEVGGRRGLRREYGHTSPHIHV